MKSKQVDDIHPSSQKESHVSFFCHFSVHSFFFLKLTLWEERYICVWGESDKFLSMEKRVEKKGRSRGGVHKDFFIYLGTTACLEKSIDSFPRVPFYLWESIDIYFTEFKPIGL